METVSVVKNHRARNKAFVLLILTALLWSTSGLFIKLIDWNPMAIAGGRSVFATFLMVLIMRRQIRFTWSFPQIGGAFAYAAMVIMFVIAVKMTTAANAILLQYTAPLFIAVLGGWFLKERVNRLDWGIIGLVLGGVLLFFIDDLSFSSLCGNIAAVASGMAFACFILCMRKQKDGSPMETIIFGNIITALAGLPFMFQSSPGVVGWGGLILFGCFQLGPFLLYSIAIKSVAALDSSLILTIEPLLNPVWVFIVVGEIPGRWAFLGGFVVLSALTGRNFCVAQKEAYHAPVKPLT